MTFVELRLLLIFIMATAVVVFVLMFGMILLFFLAHLVF